MDLCGELAGLVQAVTDLSISQARRLKARVAVPDSMVVAPGPGTVGDALLIPPGKGAMMGGKPALFRGDWKLGAEDAVRQALGLEVAQAQPRSLRTHISIDTTTGTAADRMLYVIDAVEPAGALWSCVVDFGAIADPEARCRIAGALESGLDGIGRTGASLRLERADALPLPRSSQLRESLTFSLWCWKVRPSWPARKTGKRPLTPIGPGGRGFCPEQTGLLPHALWTGLRCAAGW